MTKPCQNYQFQLSALRPFSAYFPAPLQNASLSLQTTFIRRTSGHCLGTCIAEISLSPTSSLNASSLAALLHFPSLCRHVWSTSTLTTSSWIFLNRLPFHRLLSLLNILLLLVLLITLICFSTSSFIPFLNLFLTFPANASCSSLSPSFSVS
jgi:hypothetical protein